MARNSSRSGRLSDVLHRELAKLIRVECTDPRLGMVTVSGVDVTDDLSFARVYITVLEADKQKSSIEALNHAAGFFRTQLSKHLTLRIVPKLSFYYDESLATGARMDQLLASIKDNTPPENEND